MSRDGTIYRTPAGRECITQWCHTQLAEWHLQHERVTVVAQGAKTHVVIAGSGGTTIVYVPGTNFNAAASLPLASALVAAGHRIVLPDVPGQPGLSSGQRGLSSGRVSWYGTWLSDLLGQVVADAVVVMGHSFGAAIAMSCGSPQISRLILISPGGLTRLRLTPGVLAAYAAWSLRPRPATSSRLLRLMLAADHDPRSELIEWMTLVAQYSRSSGAPGSADLPGRPVPRLVLAGEKDVFLPPRRLAPAVLRELNTDLRVIAGAGHLLVDEFPEYLAALVNHEI